MFQILFPPMVLDVALMLILFHADINIAHLKFLVLTLRSADGHYTGIKGWGTVLSGY